MHEIKTVAYVPLSHPFVERLTGTIRRDVRTARPELFTQLVDFARTLAARANPFEHR